MRNATLQVVATATIAAYVNLGGLGRYIFDGIGLYRYDLVLVGALLVAVLALVLDGLLAVAVWASRRAPVGSRAPRRTSPVSQSSPSSARRCGSSASTACILARSLARWALA